MRFYAWTNRNRSMFAEGSDRKRERERENKQTDTHTYMKILKRYIYIYIYIYMYIHILYVKSENSFQHAYVLDVQQAGSSAVSFVGPR